MRVISAQEIEVAMQLADLAAPLENAFKMFSSGDSSGSLGFLRPNGGEVHIKSGFMQGSNIFAVKVSAGFAANATKGLPIWDGVVMAFDANTGAPIALIQDGGLLTDWRTAMAGAVATRALARKNARTLGIAGTGIQGYFQPLAHAAILEFDELLIWGRNADKADNLKTKLEKQLGDKKIRVCTSLEALVQQSEVLVTATSSLEPIIQSAWVQNGTHITAVGADDEHKRELESSLIQRADIVVVDSRNANEKYGDLKDSPIQVLELGEILEQPELGRKSDRQITIAKLIGLGVQDLAAVEILLEKL